MAQILLRLLKASYILFLAITFCSPAEAGEVNGRVLNEERRPISQATVRFTYLTPENRPAGETLIANTNASGDFRFPEMRFGEKYFLTVEADEYRARAVSQPALIGTRKTLETIILLRTDRWMEGTVVNRAGKPLQGAVVEVPTGCCRQRVGTATDADGRFRIEGLSNLVEPEVIVQHRDHGYYRFPYVRTNIHRLFTMGNAPFPDDPPFDWEAVRKAVSVIEGKPAPALAVSRWLQGTPVSLQKLRGKPAVLHFWTADDRKSVESLRMAEAIWSHCGSGGVAVIAIHEYTEDAGKVQKALKEQGIRCSAVIDAPSAKRGSQGKTFEAYRLPGSHFSVLITPRGYVNTRHANDQHIILDPSYSAFDTQMDIASKARRMGKNPY
jgi:hypothetical protein